MRPNRNVRNNNPLNIRYNPANDWQGQTGSDGEFSQFIDVEHGFRAAYKLIQNYQNWYGLTSISDIVNRWAPPNENDTDGYIDYIAEKLDKLTWTPVTDSEIPELLYWMAEKEGAKGAFTIEQIERGIALA